MDSSYAAQGADLVSTAPVTALMIWHRTVLRRPKQRDRELAPHRHGHRPGGPVAMPPRRSLIGCVERGDLVRRQRAVVDVYLVDRSAPEVDGTVVVLRPAEHGVPGSRVAWAVRDCAGERSVDVEPHLVVLHVPYAHEVVPDAGLWRSGVQCPPAREAEREHVVLAGVLQEELAVSAVAVLADRGLEAVARLVQLDPRRDAVVAGGVHYG